MYYPYAEFSYFSTINKVRAFLIHISYYRHEIPNFQTLSKPLFMLIRLNPLQFQWTDFHHQIYVQLHTHFIHFRTSQLHKSRKSG
jgi:hypothetical protein